MSIFQKLEKPIMILAAVSALFGILLSKGNPNADLGYRILTLIWIGVAYLKTLQIQKLEDRW
jgi:hypothetical protein